MWLLTKILLLVCMLQSMLFWPTTLYTRHWLVIFAALSLLIFNSKKWFATNMPVIGLLLSTLILIADSIVLNGGIASIAIAITYFTGICLFRLNDTLKENLLDFVSKWYAIIIGISLVGYLAWLIIGFSSFGVLKNPDYTNYSDHLNYILFLLPEYHHGVTRFSGPFIEPGHLGMISSFLLYANKFNFKHKKYLWVILAGIFFSLSLAGYVLLISAYAIYRGIGIKQVIAATILVIGTTYVCTDLWNNGNNPVNEKIIERLRYDDERMIRGNNRNLYSTELYFIKMVNDGSFIWGIGAEKYRDLQQKKIVGGAGLTVFLISNGIIGLILVLIYYSIVAFNGIDRKYALGFLCLICLCFLQRAYPFWMAWLVPYITSIHNQHLYPKNRLQQ